MEVWDFSVVLYRGLDLTPLDPFEFSGLRKFQNKKEAIDAILKLTPQDMTIIFFHYAQYVFLWIFRYLSKSRGFYSVM